MWYMIGSELQKVWKKKSFLIMLFVIIAVNIAMLFYSAGQSDIPAKAYKKFDSHLQKLSEKDREEYISAYEEKVKGLMFIQNINMFAANNPENGSKIVEEMKNENPELYHKYYNDWKNKNYVLYTDDIFEESDFMEDVEHRIIPEIRYNEYLESIESKEEEALGISIFANSVGNETKENVFSKKVIRHTADKYCRMDGVKTEIYTYKWVDNFVSEGITEILLALITFVLVYQMIYEEKKKKLFGVITATPRGRIDCIISKMTALWINTGLVTILMYGVVFVYSALNVGIYGLGAPVQSTEALIACPYKLCMWKFMLLVLAIKWMVLFAFGLILLFISILVSHYVITFAAGITLWGVSVMEYYLVSGASKWNALHYMNLWQFLKSEQVVGNYVLIKIFEEPKSVCMMMVIFLGIMISVFAVVGIITFGRSKNLINNKEISFTGVKVLKEKISKIGLHQRIHKSVWGYECYKILVMNLGILIIALFIVGMAVSGKNENCYLTPNEICYRQWMQEFHGKLTEEKEERIQNQKAYYDKVLQQLENLEQKFDNGEIEEREYEDRKMNLERELAFYPAFLRVYERYEYVKKDGDRQFVYEEGYNKLMGKKDHLYLGTFMIMNLVLILFLTTAFTTDKEKGMHSIIRTTPRGRLYAVRSKIIICFMSVSVMYLCFLIRNIYIAQRNYGMESLLVSASNMKGFGAVPESISILILFVGIVLLQMFCMLVISSFIMFASYQIGNTVHALVWEIIVLLAVVVVVNQIYPFL